MQAATQRRIERALDSRIVRLVAVAGGDINQAWRADLDDDRRVFIKTNANAPRGMFYTEALGLGWLAEPSALRVPAVVAASDAAAAGLDAFLVLEWIESSAPTRTFDATLGRGLGELHREGAARFGLQYDNFIGSLSQSNRPHDTWVAFYWCERIEPQLRTAIDRGRLDQSMARKSEILGTRLQALMGPEEPPARLHGDLWSGNLMVGPAGEPCLIDPAVYGGHREMDLGMMLLFGGFSESTIAAYREVYPLAPGAEERRGLMQLYPLLVHVNLFGGSYSARASDIVKAYI